MCERLLPRRGADHLSVRGGLAGGTGNALTRGIHSSGQLAIIVLVGELDVASAPALAGRLEPLAETGSHLILDLAGVQFCDCAGLSLFPAFTAALRAGRGRRSRAAAPGSR